MNAAMEKRQARSLKLAERKALAPEARKAADKAINAEIMALAFFKSCPLLASYVSDGSEPDLAEAMEAVLADGRRLCLPRFKDDGAYGFAEIRDLKRDLRVGKYGLKEPKPELPEPAQEDLAKALWLVPGVAFDERGRRLGRGKGVYDRLLSGGCGLSIGVFYECQKCESLPVEGHDLGLDMIATEAGLRDLSVKEREK